MNCESLLRRMTQDWECRLVSQEPLRQLLITTSLMPNNDCIELMVESANGKMLVHDMGNTYDYLYLQGIDLASSAQRNRLRQVQRILENYHADLVDFVIRRETIPEELPVAVNLVLEAIKEICILQYSLKPYRHENFKEQVYALFAARQSAVTLDYRVTGFAKTHFFDIRLNGRDEILGKTISATSSSVVQASVERCVFAFIDVQKTDRVFSSAIFYDDTTEGRLGSWKKFDFDLLSKYEIKSYGIVKDRTNLVDLAEEHKAA
jgi:hypothetical protein